jgi:toxin ParE1/3/4
MPSVVIRPQALLDLAEIWAFIANDSVKHADKFAMLVDTQFRALGRRPHLGRNRPELAADLRSFPIGRYVIFYRAQDSGVEITRVLHGARDVESIIQGEED